MITLIKHLKDYSINCVLPVTSKIYYKFLVKLRSWNSILYILPAELSLNLYKLNTSPSVKSLQLNMPALLRKKDTDLYKIHHPVRENKNNNKSYFKILNKNQEKSNSAGLSEG